MTSITFPVSTKPTEKYGGGGDFSADSHADDLVYLNSYIGNNCTEVVLMSEVPKNADLSGQCFINTVVDAYSFHHNLVIRPDDIWAVMMTQFSLYISKNSQELRDKFVNFEGKQTVAIALPGELKDLKGDEFTKLVSDELNKNVIDDELKAWILPKFSTTTDTDTVTVGLAFMASMKSYPETRYLGCGIPNVTLEGTVQDWQDILGKLEKLKEYKLDKWYDLLKPVIQEFVNAKAGTVDTVFWQRICHYEPNASATTYLSGWITVFCVFDNDGNWIDSNWTPKPKDEDEDDGDQFDDEDDDGDDTDMDLNLKDWLRIDMERIPVGLLELNVELKDSSDKTFQTVMMAGHMGVEIKQDGVTIQPLVAWAVGLKPSASDEENKNENGDVDQFYGTGNDKDSDEDPDIPNDDEDDDDL